LKVWLNGGLVDEADARISPSDHGFLLGDGVFETLRTYDGRLVMLAEHLERLEAGARAMGIEAPDRTTLARGARELVAGWGGSDVRVRITLTSGTGPAGLLRGDDSPTILISAIPLAPWPETATAVIAPWPHDEHNPLAGVKTTSRADTVLAMVYARQHDADEALFFNQAGNLCEATTANVFVVRRGKVETPPLSAGCLAGITRERVLRLCGVLGIASAETDLSRKEFGTEDEIFLTSSTREIQPLVQVDSRLVGSGGCGPVTARLKAALAETMETLGISAG
jgi:branched-chain amino acid aminotransferase